VNLNAARFSHRPTILGHPLVLWTLLLLRLASVAPAQTAPWTVLKEWRFDRDGDRLGWQPNNQLTNVQVAAGTLSCRAVGDDPILELQSSFELKAAARQVLEIELQADRDGTAEWFWSNTDQGKYGGFSQAMSLRFPVTGDRQWHTYRVMPGWHTEGRIARLRFDPFDAATFAFRSIRILEPAAAPPSSSGEFDFAQSTQGWEALNGATLHRRAQTLEIHSPTAEAMVLSPALAIDADDKTYVSVRMAVDRGTHATLTFAARPSRGFPALSFAVAPDGREHTYNVDMLAAHAWSGEILAIGLRPSDAPGAQASLRWLKISRQPQGPAELKLVSFLMEDGLARSGLPTSLAARILNVGGEPAGQVRLQLKLPAGVEVLSPVQDPIVGPAPGCESLLRWQIRSRRPVTGEASLRLGSGNSSPALSARTRLTFTEPAKVPHPGYVPEPQPVRGDNEVGVYYFPGWNSADAWARLHPYPERKPLLGWYREGDPEVADWQIKWAVEHGITYFAYDWYWSNGARQLEHGLDAYFKARYHHLLKFCLLWANHNPPHSSSRADCVAVTRFWIEHYFRRAEHLTIAGKPAVYIFSPSRLTEDLGSAQVSEALAAMRDECRKAGLTGLYLIACVGNAGQARVAAAEGYDAVTAYTWPELGLPGTGNYGPYDSLIAGYQRQWEHLMEASPLPLLLPLNGGWDSRPWHGENNLIRFGRTPQLFQRHLEDACRVLAQAKPGRLVPRHVLIEAWNEWGEGAYIEPHQEFGFGYLDAIRTVLANAPARHADAIPIDAGLGPYDLAAPLVTSPTNWDFALGLQGWEHSMNLTDRLTDAQGLHARSVTDDPAFFSPTMRTEAGQFQAVELRLKLEPPSGSGFEDLAQLFWSTTRTKESEASSVRFKVLGDGQWHDYRLPVGDNRHWRGTISQLRLDPCNLPGVRVHVRWVRLAN